LLTPQTLTDESQDHYISASSGVLGSVFIKSNSSPVTPILSSFTFEKEIYKHCDVTSDRFGYDGGEDFQ